VAPPLELRRRGESPGRNQEKSLNALADFSRSNWHDDAALLILAVS